VIRGRATAGLRLAGVLLALAAGSAASDASGSTTQRLAVIASQNHGGPGTTPLRYADADAWKVRDVLVELGGFPSDAVRVLPGVGRAELIAALTEVGRRARSLTASGDAVLLLVFYSGHADRDGLLLGRQRLSYAELTAVVEQSGAQVQLQIVDACHAGSLTRPKGATPVPSFLVDVEDTLAAEGRVVITSSAEDEYSQESDLIGASYFTHFMVTGLRGAADTDGDRLVTLDELYRYLYQETLYHTAGTRAGPQHPAYSFDLSGQGTLVLADLQAASAALVFPPDEDGRYAVFDRRNRTFVGEIDGPSGPVRLAVVPGAYLVQRRDDDRIERTEVRLDAGDEVEVDGLAMVEGSFADDVAKGLALRWKRRTRVLLRAGGGVHAALQPSMREAYFPTMPLVSVGAGVEWRTVPRTELLVDVAFGRAAYELPGLYEQDTVESHLDAGLSYRFVKEISGFRMALGPRFALLSYWRSPPGDQLSGFSLGIDGGIGMRVRDRVGVALDVRVGYMLNQTALEDQSHVHMQALLRLDLAL